MIFCTGFLLAWSLGSRMRMVAAVKVTNKIDSMVYGWCIHCYMIEIKIFSENPKCCTSKERKLGTRFFINAQVLRKLTKMFNT